jgi:hypothetical protein
LREADDVYLAKLLIKGEALRSNDIEAAALAIAYEADCFPFYIHHIVKALKIHGIDATCEYVAHIVATQLVDANDPWALLHLGKIEPASASRAYLESAIVRNSAEGNLRKRIILEDLKLSLPEQYDWLPELTNQPEAVVQHIGHVFRAGEPFPSSDNLEGWALAWEQAAESAPEFRLSVRLLRTGINFVKAGGNQPGILLDLTSPERTILTQALGLEKVK